MKFYAFKKQFYTADLYDLTFDDNGRPTTETFRETRRLSLDTGDSTNLSIDATAPVRLQTLMRNIKDRAGRLIYPNETNGGVAYVVWFEQPILSVFGTVEGYSAKARKQANV